MCRVLLIKFLHNIINQVAGYARKIMTFSFGNSSWKRHRADWSFSLLTGILMASLLIQPFHEERFSICLFKNIFGIPCPGCGMTRAFLFLGHGEIHDAFTLNPNVFLAFFIVLFLWFNKITLLLTGKEVKIHLTHREKVLVYILAGFAMIAVWVYNLFFNPNFERRINYAL